MEWYECIFYTEKDEVPYLNHGDIGFYNDELPVGIKVKMDLDGNIDFEAGVEGLGYDTDDIKDYETLLMFLYDHYDEIEEDVMIHTRRDCIDELIDICKKKIELEEPTKEKDFECALKQIRYLTSKKTCYICEDDVNFRAICHDIADEILKKYKE